MSGVRGKRSRGGDVRTDNDATTGSNPAVNDGVPNGAPPGTSSRPNETNQQQKRHSVDTVLAQAGFVGHRTDASHATGNNGFLGDTTGSLIPPIFPSTTYARDTSRGGYDLRHLVTYPKDEIAEHHHVDGEKNDNYDAKHQNEGATHQPTPRPLMYSRPDNPGYTQAESLIASLEGGENALLFSSGMAAVAAVAASTLKHGDRCAIPKNCYFAVRVFFQDYCRRNGVECYLYDDSHEDMTRAAYGLSREEFESNQKQCETMEKLSPVLVDWGAFKNDEKCKLIWVETPSNPTWRVTDIQKASQLAKILRATLCCDNTVLTPLCCRPLSLGADLVMHSATKYLNGHSDVVAGVVVGRKVDWRDWRAGDDPDDTYKICLRQVGKSFQSITDADQFTVFQFLQKTRSFGGAVLGPFEAWLLVRGLRTLHVRVRAQCASALYLARKLQKHPDVAEVLYPGLANHPGHAIAVQQQSGSYAEECYVDETGDEYQKTKADRMFGGMLSVRVKGGGAVAIAVTGRVKIWTPATSLGGVESLVEHRKSVEGPHSETPDDLLRLSVGLENPADLLLDLEAAIEAAAKGAVVIEGD